MQSWSPLAGPTSEWNIKDEEAEVITSGGIKQRPWRQFGKILEEENTENSKVFKCNPSSFTYMQCT